MKRLGFSLLFVVLSTISFSQIDFGPRVGLGTAYTDVSTTSSEIKSGEAAFGFNVGLFARVGTKKLKVMPELLYSTTTTNVIFNDGSPVDEILESELNRIDVPLSLQYYPVKIFNLQGGLIGSYLIDENSSFPNEAEEAIQNYKDFTLGYQFGAGLDLGSFLIDLKYSSSMGDITNSGSIGSFAFDERQSMVLGMLGIKIF